MMRSVQIIEPGKVILTETSKPQMRDDSVLIQVEYIGLCGSDLSSYLGKNPMVSYPVVPGHEVSGRIVALGEQVPKQLKKGAWVTVNPYTHCGTCPSCKKGRINACQFNQTLGVQRNGALCEFIALPWQKVIPASGLTPEELALTEPLSVGFHAINRGRVADIDTVMVLGCGMIGAGAIIRSALRGASVIAVDIDDAKLALAKELGAQHAINAKKEHLNTRVLEITQQQGPDLVIEAAGNPATYLAAVDEVGFCGRVVCIGYAAKEVAFATKKFVQKEIDILGSRNALQSDIEAVIKYLKRKTCPVQKLISKKIKAEETGNALQEWASDPGRVMKILVGF